MRKYNIRGCNVDLGFDKKYKILYITPNESSSKVIALYINTGNMLSVDALDIRFNISNINPNIMQPRKLQYLLSAAGVKKSDIISIISAYNNPIINNKNTYKMSKCIMYYRMHMLETFLKFTTRYKLSLLSKETILLMGFTRCEKYIYTHLGMMRGACYFRFTDDLNRPQTYILGKTSVFVFDGDSFIKEQAKVLVPIGFNHKIINNNHIIILDRTYTTNSGYVLPVTVLKINDILNVEFFDVHDKEDIENYVDRLYNIKYKNDIFII